MTFLTSTIAIIIAYLIGSIPTGILIAKVFGKGKVDIQANGSRNIGATNVNRLLGRKAGAVTLLGDILKGFVVIYLIDYIFFSDYVTCLAIVAVIIGNCYSIFLGFTGGKGVATTYGIYFAIAPLVSLVAIVVDGIVIKVSGTSSIGSLVGMLTLFVLFLFKGLPFIYIITTTVVVGLVYYRHKTNIQDLMKSWKS